MEKNALKQEELVEKFSAQIKEDKNYKRFFSKYSSSSVDFFIETYALKKAIWTVSGPGFKTEMERMEMMWETEAMNRLEEIQQVKLFLFQCKYRALSIDEPVAEVRTIFDFLYWKDNVLNARFLEAITPEDIKMYADYLSSPYVNHEPFVFIEQWQDFEDIRMAYNTPDEIERNVPEWYIYYFSHTGRGIELTLPDLKKEKDVGYFLKGNTERVRLQIEADEKAIKENPALATDTREYFIMHDEDSIDNFMQTFEDKENREMLKIWNAWTVFNEKEDVIREDLNILMYAKENVHIKENESWIDAIRLAASQYRSIKITESLPAAYEQYKMNLDLGITFPEKENSRSNADFYNDLVLLGRKLLGEPEDFNY